MGSTVSFSVNKRKGDWGVDLPNLPVTWVDLCVEGVSVPGHISHTFLCSLKSPMPTTFDPVASFVGDSHPDRRHGWKAIMKKNAVLKVCKRFTKLLSGNTMLYVKREPQRQFLSCVF